MFQSSEGPRSVDTALLAQSKFAEALQAGTVGDSHRFRDGMKAAGGLFLNAFGKTPEHFMQSREQLANGAVSSFFRGGHMELVVLTSRIVLGSLDQGRMDPVNLANIRSMDQQARQALTPLA